MSESREIECREERRLEERREERREEYIQFQTKVLSRLDQLAEGQKEIKEGFWGVNGVEPRLRKIEERCTIHRAEINNNKENITDLKSDRPKLFVILGLGSLIGGFLGRFVPWKT